MTPPTHRADVPGPRRRELRRPQHPAQSPGPQQPGAPGSCQVPPPQAAALQGAPGALAAPWAGRGDRATPRGRRSPPPRQALPSTLVRVRTGLLQALSGATRAECFFMVSRPPAGAAVAYILRPAERAGCRRPPPSGSAGLAAQALARLPAALTAAAPRSASSRPAAAPRARSLPPQAAANSDVTAKCAPHAHPGSPAPPPPERPARSRARPLPRGDRSWPQPPGWQGGHQLPDLRTGAAPRTWPPCPPSLERQV